MQCRAMVITLGALAPTVNSINHTKPEFVCFLVSEKTLDTRTQVLDLIDCQPQTHTIITYDPQSVSDCYEKARECIDYVQKAGYACEDVIVDITGGTKPMAGGLAVAAASLGYRFRYVGGERDAATGLVKDGNEEIITDENFFDLFAVEERKQIKLLFNRAQYGGAKTIAELAAAKARPDWRIFFEALRRLIEGYELWDRFEHNKGRVALKEGAQKLQEFLTIQQRYQSQFQPFLDGVEQNLAFLNDLTRDAKGGSRLCNLFVNDLLANARRRAQEGAYDDAAARLYSAIERRAQVLLLDGYKIDTSGVMPEQIPDALRDEYQERYCGRDGAIQIPLMAAYRLLAALGDPSGQKVIADDRLKDLLAARNDSILAHGISPIGPDTYQKLYQIALDLADVTEADLPQVPELDI
ncbi:MAG TPA: TIGR02710 family CRISPR-associated protein [Firmicutes bacterium]|jgi:CRISPR-associated protein (TIGR02710 family)|nr:TIGR02710 family CRISPR-associated protein [Bacillota bacterium]